MVNLKQVFWKLALSMRNHTPNKFGAILSTLYHRVIAVNFKYELAPVVRDANGVSYQTYNYISDTPDVTLSQIFDSFSNGDVLYDIGAHLGDHSIPTALAFPETSVVAFEPDPRTARQLEANVRANPTAKDRIKVLNIGLGDVEGNKEFYRARPSIFSSFNRQQVISRGGVVKEAETVPISTVDDILTDCNFPKPTHIKIDVQGYGVQVLDGMEETLQKHDLTIVVEPHDNEVEIKNLLKNAGYTVDITPDDRDYFIATA